MPDWVSEHIGEIALLIYIFYPILKRWWDRRKKKAEQAQTEPAKSRRQKRAEAKQARAEARAGSGASPRTRSGAGPGPRTEPTPPPLDYADAARRRIARVRDQGKTLLQRAERNPKLTRLVPALREDLLGRVSEVERTLQGKPSISTVLQEMQVIEGLEALLRTLHTMSEQRARGGAPFLADADAIADACYAPILDFARARGLGLKTSQPVSITGDWSLSIVPRFAATRVAPLRIPTGFGHSLWGWPAIAHEIGHDLFFSLESIERDLYERLGLPRRVAVASSEAELDGAWLRSLFGAWLPEVFADTMGTLILGPAYVETMRRTFAQPSSPQRTAAVLQDGGFIDEHPPERLRVFMATRVLHHLGRHDEANAIWDRWESDHPDVAFYFLPLGGDWVGLSEETMHGVATSMIDTLIQRPWPELAGFHLRDVPGLAYLHAEHAEVRRLSTRLASGDLVDADPRWIVAAAVLAAAKQPTLHDAILQTARQSIRGIGEAKTEEPVAPTRARTHAATDDLIGSIRSPDAIREAIILGAAIKPYPGRRLPRRWR